MCNKHDMFNMRKCANMVNGYRNNRLHHYSHRNFRILMAIGVYTYCYFKYDISDEAKKIVYPILKILGTISYCLIAAFTFWFWCSYIH